MPSYLLPSLTPCLSCLSSLILPSAHSGSWPVTAGRGFSGGFAVHSAVVVTHQGLLSILMESGTCPPQPIYSDGLGNCIAIFAMNVTSRFLTRLSTWLRRIMSKGSEGAARTIPSNVKWEFAKRFQNVVSVCRTLQS